VADRRRSWWGWGWEDEALTTDQRQALAKVLAVRLEVDDLELRDPPRLADIDLRPPRVTPPDSLAALCSVEPYDRAAHTYGKGFRDVVRAFHGELPAPPDVVVFPRDETDVAAALEWCASSRIAAVPYGGGSSVVGGVETGGPWAGEFEGVVSIDLGLLGRVLEVDRDSRAARIQAGALGPELEAQLRPRGLTLRHFPQSFEFSSLGGWIATRSGGHYATNYTHIDDFVESVRMVSPAGVVESRRLPGSGAGPSPDRLVLGSEGTLGVITEAWMRVQDRPRWRATASVRFTTFEAGVQATRAVAQAALFPSNCRLLDAGEAAGAGVTDAAAVLLLGFESAHHPVDAWIEQAVACCADHGGTMPEGVKTTSTEGASGNWRASFMRAPYGRDAIVAMGCIADTFETSITWDRFGQLYDGVMEAARRAVRSVCGAGTVACRFTHVYPDGPAPYFTILGLSRHGSQIAMWDEVKAAASEAVIAQGGTITHHHAVGRDHRPWYDRQRPALFGKVLEAAKGVLDPAGVLNPGVLIG